MAEEDARQRQAEQAACLTKALQGLQDGHQQLHEWLGNLEASSADVQLQLAALQVSGARCHQHMQLHCRCKLSNALPLLLVGGAA